MTTDNLIQLIEKGESSTVQFKERLPHQDSLAQELIAFSNSGGGLLIIGVNDKTGCLHGLSFEEIQKANQQLVNVASQSVFPPVTIFTEVVKVNNNNLLTVAIEEGIGKPYKDRLGSIYLKNGSDKRRVTSNDEMPVVLTSVDDIDVNYYKKFILKNTI